jgi:hypothetical protein
MHSAKALLVIGLVWSIGWGVAWYYACIGSISGSLLIGIGASVIAAALVAGLSPFSEAAYRRFISLGIDEVWPSRQAIDRKKWVDWVSGAKYECILLGIAHGEWCKDLRFPGTLRDRLENGVRVKMLFLDPRSPAAELRAQEEDRQKKRDMETRQAIRASIKFMWDFRQELGASRNRLRLYVCNATPSCGLTLVDDFMIVTHYLAGLPNRTSPALLVGPSRIGMEKSLYDIYLENMNNVEAISEEIDDRNIRSLTAE